MVTFVMESFHLSRIQSHSTMKTTFSWYFPRRFIRNYGNDLSSPVILKVCSGAKWEVELVKHDGEIWLQNGWKEFQKYYSLAHGSFLVFEYDQGNCDFNVIIFDKSATEIDYPVSIINGDTNYEPNPEKAESNVSVEILTHFSPSLKTRKKSPLPFSFSPPNKKIKLENSTGQVEARKGGVSCQKQTQDEVVDRIKPLNAGEKAKALDKATINFKSKNPFFMIAMQPSYVHLTYQVAIPASFVNKYFNKQCDNAILSTVDGKSWSVVYNYDVTNRKPRARMSHGWKEFAHENHLQIGDVCVFELINRAKTTLKVFIFRCIKDEKINPSPGNSKQLKQEKSSGNRKFMQRHSCLKVLEAANKFTSLNPFFKVKLRASHLEHGCLNLPKGFVIKHTKKSISNIILQAEGREWPVKLIFDHSHRGWFSAGWTSFAKENSLQVGDVCIFELVNSKTPLLKVSIFRNVE
ncbi:B3 domain-containing transcription factor VRN1 isoform X2 [Ricinus communis]|uniref:B3 domain-containing transcription factor VRN1 isoform X2 n=1 Tax=Ricinus communis TaxID=3988 RepID=UPI00201AB14E|nr:B3 domain-containing transcription factor VRN1 isoform X2 [Ricinus communis]